MLEFLHQVLVELSLRIALCKGDALWRTILVSVSKLLVCCAAWPRERLEYDDCYGVCSRADSL